MDFYDVVGQVLELLQRQKRVSYRVLKRQFSIDDDYIEDLKEEFLYAHESSEIFANIACHWMNLVRFLAACYHCQYLKTAIHR